ncbi:G-type lectin S-receptor-like serine/threonine-protein kinase CES101 [Linum perenne]
MNSVDDAVLVLLPLLLFLHFQSFGCYLAAAANTLSQLSGGGGVSRINSSTTLVSTNGVFTLAFHRPGSPDSNSTYLGISYKDELDTTTLFWIANRAFPIPDDSGSLILDPTLRSLKLNYSGGDLSNIFQVNSSSSSNLTAVLQDSGNFALLSASQTQWQSFDFPTDSWLPGMKLGLDRRTGRNRILTSWVSDSNPAPGAFTLEWDPVKEELVMKRRGVSFWTSGRQLKPDEFQNLNIGMYSLRYNISRVSNPDEDYLIFSASDTYPGRPDFTVWRLTYDGDVLDLNTRIYVVNVNPRCDGDTTEGGCQRWPGPDCRIRDGGDMFVQRRGGFIGGEATTDGNATLGIGDCKNLCWTNCQCAGTSSLSNNGTGCVFWSGNFNPQPDSEVAIIDIIVGAASNSTRVKKWIWALVAVAVVLLLAAILGVSFIIRKRKLKAERLLAELMTSDSPNDIAEMEADGANHGHNLKIYSIATVMAATNNFSLRNKLGEGGFGPVYKGQLEGGGKVAVKRLSRSSGQGLIEFRNELLLIAKLQHMNLVRLVGCCIYGEEKMLVYEYMPNKSLDSFIFDESKRQVLDWTKRFSIIEGIAQGLLYLHKYSRVKIIHRDLKASNILLDENLNPKISDFGMARIFKANAVEANTNRVVGTYGYMSPEYAMEGTFSIKSDVFSFGDLLLEIVSGRKSNHLIHDLQLNLVGYAWQLWREGTPLQLMDPTLTSSCDTEQVLRCINVGLLCIEHSPEDRPRMSEVISMLTSEIVQLPTPKQPAFTTYRLKSDGEDKSSSNPESFSTNEATITTLSAR